MNTNKIDQYGRTLYADSVLNRIVTLFPPAKWERQKDGQMGYTFSAVPCGAFNLGKFLLSPPDELLQLQTDIRAGQRQKPEMYGMTPAAFCSYRRSANVQYLTGLMAFDIDAKDNAHRLANYDDLKDEIRKIPYVAYCGRSVSGTGFWGLLFIGYNVTASEYKAAFKAMQQDFASMGIKIDSKPADPASLRFFSFDPEGYLNHYPEAYTRRYVAPPAPKPTARTYTASTTQIGETSKRPGDVFNDTYSPVDVLTAHGWQIIQQTPTQTHLRRPGAKTTNTDATYYSDAGKVKIWSTSAGLPTEGEMKAFEVYTRLEHGGDWKAAARALKAAGVQ